jgi:hypothetical protein
LISGKFAGENDDWQAAKTKIGENYPPRIQGVTGRVTPKQSGGGQ